MITPAQKLALITKHAKKFVSNSLSRPVLKGVHYAANGSVYATNSYYALRIQNAHTFTDPMTVDAKTGEKIDSPYPDVDKVIPNNFHNELIIPDINKAFHRSKVAFEIAKTIEDKNLTSFLTVNNGLVHLQIENDEIEYQAWIGNTVDTEEFKLALNAEYLFNSLNVFKDAGTKEIRIGVQNDGPILMSDKENEIDILIMPIKVTR